MPQPEPVTIELLDVSGYSAEVLAETAHHLRLLVEGMPDRPRRRWLVAQLEHLDAAVDRARR